MSNIGQDLKRRIANRIFNKVDWANYHMWLEDRPNMVIQDLSITDLGSGTFQIRLKTWKDGTRYFTIKITENI